MDLVSLPLGFEPKEAIWDMNYYFFLKISIALFTIAQKQNKCLMIEFLLNNYISIYQNSVQLNDVNDMGKYSML